MRFLVEDDPGQGARARARIQAAVSSDTPLFVSDLVICELVWVLERGYRVPRREVAGTLASLLRTRHLRFQDPDRLDRAVRRYASARGDLADYLIREHARAAGCSEVLTFDRTLLGEAGFVEP